MVKIDGKAFSQVILEKIREEHNQLKEKYGKQAGLAVVIVGNNPASQVYVRNKMKACENVGFYSENIELDENISEKELLQEIDKLNKNDRINGILVQLPLPSHINELKIIDSISPEKDVDGFHVANIGKMVIGDETGFISCTPYGIMQLLEEYKIEIAGKDAVIIGRSNIVGKPMALMLIQKGATVQVCNSRTKDLRKKLNDADIIIVAAGVPKLLKKEDVKEGAVVIDVGINRVDGKICGDVDYEEVAEKTSYITPVPGGVGPMTIASLIKNTFKSYKNSLKY
ncbi:tetrahydrofolate dehydrogenase/cyclohydrolase, NAD(P)-binding domain protein [Leptotrichia sp. oral taxon 215 str. W9775]|jgi:tetrahydrofolate dehydrogenase/cyclohydrolase, NAD(P)-binding domain protein|uniref:bifunctional methylenetetrahydrofolate dehydrogenase/methenyltetrahydrofolate cyclohydrolase FolD n=1 Tax=Leptotrichia sp. oral taxon 215 TaxID=712359 RepID=UPI0003ADDD2A|nr:bifunctional methylenetetrahydrofolate dehydrogenase/methenyltetrahydrofolate cyclohydrolase FolD [Leptotrichia sp. oral taxon 215]ERK65442.1 tetrahydrofolate dehydrogenase/cyclohydrolase, NAD(P)-binding domain protein [Leptotrichia sp. oral taxon 215 str. W9775]